MTVELDILAQHLDAAEDPEAWLERVGIALDRTGDFHKALDIVLGKAQEAQKNGDGRWVTIGAQDAGEGKKEGGTHVFIRIGSLVFNPADHPRHLAGSPKSGKFAKKGEGTVSTATPAKPPAPRQPKQAPKAPAPKPSSVVKSSVRAATKPKAPTPKAPAPRASATIAAPAKPQPKGPAKQQAQTPEATPPVQPTAAARGRVTFSMDRELHPTAQKAMKQVAASLKGNQSLTSEQKVAYATAAQKVLGSMNARALERFHAHTSNGLDFFADSVSIAKALSDRSDHFAELVRGGRGAAGAYDKKNQKLLLDGGERIEGLVEKRGKATHAQAHEVYAHEFAHAVDGPTFNWSRSKPWNQAWTEEIVRGGGLNKCAMNNPSEGFAEFGRLLLTGGKDHVDIQRQFPKCYNFWLKQGIIDAPETSTPTKRQGKTIPRAEWPEGDGTEHHMLPDIFSESVPLDDEGGHADLLLGELMVGGKAWDESKHPRGQPANAGQFGPGGGGAKKSAPAKKAPGPSPLKRSEKPQPHTVPYKPPASNDVPTTDQPATNVPREQMLDDLGHVISGGAQNIEAIRQIGGDRRNPWAGTNLSFKVKEKDDGSKLVKFSKYFEGQAGDNEALVSRLASLAGVNCPEVKAVKVGNKTYTVAKWIDSSVALSQDKNFEDLIAFVQSDRKGVEKMLWFDYLIGYTDGHWGNYLADESGLVGIDKEFAFVSDYADQFVVPCFLVALAQGYTEFEGQRLVDTDKLLAYEFDRNTFQEAVQSGEKMVEFLREEGHSEEAEFVAKRLDSLAQIVENENVVLDDLAATGMAISYGMMR